nr:unnamed protein product [Callosobruchus analis]
MIKHIYIYQCLLKVHYTQSKYSQFTTQTRPAAEFNLETNIFEKSLTQRDFFYYGPRHLNKLPGTVKHLVNMLVNSVLQMLFMYLYTLRHSNQPKKYLAHHLFGTLSEPIASKMPKLLKK